MSGFGGFGSGGGFGQQQQQQQSTGFGGFGSTSTPSTGFGQTGTSGFGSTQTTGGGLFGGGSGTTGGFGSSGAFGSTSGGAFGAAKPAFGTATTTGGGLFGSGTATAGGSTGGFGGFGSTTASTSSPFGGGSSSGGLFGAKPAFGASTATSNPFGGAAATSSPFGGSAFGAPASTALGGAIGECQGTGSTPFQAFVEKEPNSTSNAQNSFQSIVFQQPYQKFSPEELRLADYTQGRKFGNANGQAGAFGSSSFGGGFGATTTPSTGFGSTTTGSGGLFGGGSTSSPFGAAQPAQTSGFGSTSTTGGLFGSAAKPASTGLFGSTTTPSTGGGLFGGGSSGFGSSTTGTATGGFGQTSTATGSSLFGTAGSTAAKPFSFGTAQPAATSTPFGQSTTGTSAFGGGGGGLFGSTPQQQTNTGFGQTQQPAASSNPFGGFGAPAQQTGGGLFGSNAAKPAGGLFGSTPAAAPSGGLFGSTPQQSTGTNPFGASSTTPASGGLFGAKPAGGLFGSTTQTQPSTGGLFGGGAFGGGQQAQGQQQQSGGLFGSTQQKPGGLFGGSTQQQGTSSLFGGSASQPQSGLFGGSTQQQQQQPQNSLFGGSSIYGTPQQQSLSTSIGDAGAYGSASLFADLSNNNLHNPGPIATPLSGLRDRPKRAAAIPIARLNSTSSPRFSTPPRKGYGFSYSTYASPSSASSTASTPGTFSSSTIGSGLSSFSRALTKSVSTSGLRNSYSASEGILAPGAFSAGSNVRAFGSTGSVKRLQINRSLRSDLFSPPPNQNTRTPTTAPASKTVTKRVSFDSSTAGGVNGSGNNVEQSRESVDPSPQELGLLRPRPQTNGDNSNSKSAPVESQVKGNELAIVPEENAESVGPPPLSAQKDKTPQQYWTSPTIKDIQAMSHADRKKVEGFTVGRVGVGQVKFVPPIDMTSLPIDEIVGKLVQLDIRNCTVYPDKTVKPKVGSGLNVPAVISLDNSWPRARGNKGPMKLQKHINGLKKVPDTTFVSYEQSTGIWSFRVEHFTTYAFPSDDEFDGEEESEWGQSTMSLPPDTPAPQVSTPSMENEQSFVSNSQYSRTESDPEDTFQFRKKKALPGAFEEADAYIDDEIEGEYAEQREESFLDDRSVGSESEDGTEPINQDATFDDESVSIMDQDMAGAYSYTDNTAEQYNDSQDGLEDMPETPGALMRARMRASRGADTPTQHFFATDDWTTALQKTVSPKKQDRALLKTLIDVTADAGKYDSPQPVVRRNVPDTRGFANSIDLMNSLFGANKSPAKKANAPVRGKGFEWPYAKRPKTAEGGEMSTADRTFHDQSMKPSWGADGTLIYSASPNAKAFGRSSRRAQDKEGILAVQQNSIVSARRDVVQAKFQNEASAKSLSRHKKLTVIDNSAFVPYAFLEEHVKLSDFVENARDGSMVHETLVWQLASILFDDIQIPKGAEDDPVIVDRIRKDKLSRFWQSLVADAASNKVALARTREEKAIGLLSGYKVADACAALIDGKDYHLASLVARIGVKESSKQDIKDQLRDWKKTHVLAEFSQPVRAIYELLAGNCCVCEGEKGPVEDRIESFTISTRFELDWRRSFGLRLWYGILKQDHVEEAITLFRDDLNNGMETAKPAAWYVEQNIPPLWTDERRDQREDLLWSLLKLSAFDNTDLDAIIAPEHSSLSPVDFRLSWQLGQALAHIGASDFGHRYALIADRLTISFAAQLTSEGSWLDAAFVLLHIQVEDARSAALQAHLGHNARYIGGEDSEVFKKLVTTYHIPEQWVWEAKALYQRSVVRDPRKEVEFLVKAGTFEEAHRTFRQEVAPKTIIEKDYDTLRTLLAGFKGQEDSIANWHLGGEIYQDFLDLLEAQKRGHPIEDDLIDRLLSGLPAVVQEARCPSFLETVAAETISGVVAKVVVSQGRTGKKSNANKVLQLPLTEDMSLKHTVDLSLQYYRALVSGGK